jgi:putative FmdB family regulatory protein
MPIYEYKCEKGHVFDVLQKITDEALTKCQECGAPAQRVLHPVAVHFKGSGFYNTDYGKKKGGGTPAEGSKESKSADSGSSAASSSSSSGSGSGDAKATAATAGD